MHKCPRCDYDDIECDDVLEYGEVWLCLDCGHRWIVEWDEADDD